MALCVDSRRVTGSITGVVNMVTTMDIWSLQVGSCLIWKLWKVLPFPRNMLGVVSTEWPVTVVKFGVRCCVPKYFISSLMYLSAKFVGACPKFVCLALKPSMISLKSRGNVAS